MTEFLLPGLKCAIARDKKGPNTTGFVFTENVKVAGKNNVDSSGHEINEISFFLSFQGSVPRDASP